MFLNNIIFPDIILCYYYVFTYTETALLNCQFYLRSNHKYILETHLPDIGEQWMDGWMDDDE